MGDLTGLISIARKGGFVLIGQDNIFEYDKKLHLIMLDNSAGNALLRQAKGFAQKRDIPLLMIDNLAEISKISNCKVLAVRNFGISQQIIKNIKGENFGTTT